MSERYGYRWLPQLCPICETPPTRRLGRRGGQAHRTQAGVECEIWRCDACGLVFPNPMPHPLGGPDQHYSMDPDKYFEHHNSEAKGASAAYLLTKAEALTGGKGRLLDIGAGRGEVLTTAKSKGWKTVGIEPSEGFADYAEKQSGLEIKRVPLEECGFATESFDVVLLSAVLEHLYNPDVTMGEVARILRLGGALFLDVPNERGLYFRVGNFYQKLRGRDWVVNLAPTFSPFHVFGFGPQSLQALLHKHGLKPKDWHVYAGQAMVPARGGPVGLFEQMAAHAITAVSSFGNLGTYIETWAIKVGNGSQAF